MRHVVNDDTKLFPAPSHQESSMDHIANSLFIHQAMAEGEHVSQKKQDDGTRQKQLDILGNGLFRFPGESYVICRVYIKRQPRASIQYVILVSVDGADRQILLPSDKARPAISLFPVCLQAYIKWADITVASIFSNNSAKFPKISSYSLVHNISETSRFIHL